MGKKEKIRNIYKKHGVFVGNETLEAILEDKERTKALMRVYKQEEVDSMNYILGKPEDNLYFTEFELEFISKIDLFDSTVIQWSKLIWANKDNDEELDKITFALNQRRCLVHDNN